MGKKNLTPVNLSQFFGRNGIDNPTALEAQGVEQRNIRSMQNALTNRPGINKIGNTISTSLPMLGGESWGEHIIAFNDTKGYVYDSSALAWYQFKTGLTSNTIMTLLPYYNDMYCSNGVDSVFRAVKSTLSSAITAISTTIPVIDSSKFSNSVGKVYIEGDEIDYNGVSALPIVAKTANYTTVNTDKTINGDATAGNITITLVTAVGNANLVHIIRKTDSTANTVTVDPNGAQTIDLRNGTGPTATKVLSTRGDVIVIRSNGSNWELTTLSYANATIIDNVTNVSASHASGSLIIHTIDLSNVPKGTVMESYGEKWWMSGVTATNAVPTEPWRLYYSSTATAAAPQQFYSFEYGNSSPELEIFTNYTANALYKTIKANAAGNAITITLITAAGNTGLYFIIRKTDASANIVTIDGAGAETIDGSATKTLTIKGDEIVIESNGTNWTTQTTVVSGSGVEFFAHGAEITAAVKFRDTLLVSQKDGIKYISDFEDGSPPKPIIKDFYKKDGAINEDCMTVVGGDLVYFTGARIKRVIVKDFEGIQQDNELFDRPVLDVLQKMDPNQSEAAMIYNPADGLLRITLRTFGSNVNNLLIFYNTTTNSWWVETGYVRKFILHKDKVYYLHSLIGKVLLADYGYSIDTAPDVTYYQSRHIKPNPSRRNDWAHLYLDGSMTIGTTITIKAYSGGQLISTATITSDDFMNSEQASIVGIPQAVGDDVMGDEPWGGDLSDGYLTQTFDSMYEFEKWIPIGNISKVFYYTLESNGISQRFRVETALVDYSPMNEPYRIQASY
jgi:hypothetical protein